MRPSSRNRSVTTRLCHMHVVLLRRIASYCTPHRRILHRDVNDVCPASVMLVACIVCSCLASRWPAFVPPLRRVRMVRPTRCRRRSFSTCDRRSNSIRSRSRWRPSIRRITISVVSSTIAPISQSTCSSRAMHRSSDSALQSRRTRRISTLQSALRRMRARVSGRYETPDRTSHTCVCVL
jgi:hypothetical protein